MKKFILVLLGCSILIYGHAQKIVYKKPGQDIIVKDSGQVVPPNPPCNTCPMPVVTATATTVPYTQQASVNVSGTATSPIFNFFIPQGQPGQPGSGGTGSLPNTFVINPALGADNNPDSDTWQAAINSAMNVPGGKVIIPTASNKWLLDKTINIIRAQTQVDLEAQGYPGNIRWTGGSNKSVFYLVGLNTSEWSGLNIEVPSGVTNVAIFDIDTNASIGSSSFNHFHDMYLNFNGANVVGFRMGKTNGAGIHGDISNWRIKNCVGYGPVGNPQPGTFLVQSLHGNVLANTLEDVFVAFCDGVFSNWAIPGSPDRGGCFGTFKAIDTSQNICEFYFSREGTYPVFGGRMETPGMLFKTQAGSHNIAVAFYGIRLDAAKGAGVLCEVNTPGDYGFYGCTFHREVNPSVGFNDLITLNGGGGFGTVIIEGGSTRATNIIRKVGGASQWKAYVRGLKKWKLQSDGTVPPVQTEGWYNDFSGIVTSVVN